MFLKDILYYTKAISTLTYSNTPSAYISPERLIEGLPPFLNYESGTQLTPKTLIIPKFDLSNSTMRDRAALTYRLRKLKQAGHAIKRIANDMLIDLDISSDAHYFIFNDLAPAPGLKICASLLNTPADELLICNEDIIRLLITGDASDLEEFKPFKHIMLNKHPLNQKLFEQLIHEHRETIETIEVVNCPNITDLKGDKLSNLTSLKIIPFADDGNAKMSNVKEILQNNASQLQTLLLDKCFLYEEIINDILALTALKTLSLSYCDLRGELFDNIAFGDLEQLELRDSVLNASSFEALLHSLPKLKKLELSRSNILGESSFNTVSACDLEELNLRHITIDSADTAFLQALLQRSTKLKRIKLKRIKVSSGPMFNATFDNILLDALEKLDLSESDINTASLQVLLQGAPNLKTLSLRYCKNLFEGTLNGISLTELIVLNLSCSTLNAASLQVLLQKSTKIKTLNLSGYKYLSETILDNITFRDLEVLDLHGSSINVASIQVLLQGTDKLKNLDLSNCQNISQGTFNGISLTELENLNLNSSPVNTAALQALLQHSPKIKTLNLSSCQNMTWSNGSGHTS